MKIYRLNEPAGKRLIEAKEKAKERVKKRIQRDQADESMDELMDELKKCFNKTTKESTSSWHIERYISNPHGIPMKLKSNRFDDCDESYAYDYDYDPNEDYPEPF